MISTTSKSILSIVVTCLSLVVITCSAKQHINNTKERDIKKELNLKKQLIGYEESQNILKVLVQNQCYTKDVDIGGLNNYRLRSQSGKYIRGIEAFPIVKQPKPIIKFADSIVYFCALGSFNYKTNLFFPTQNFYKLPQTDGTQKQVAKALSSKRELQELKGKH